MKSTRRAENLRYVLVYRLELESPSIHPGSDVDLMLLRLTNTALKRVTSGKSDIFCFLLPRAKDTSSIQEKLLDYGFPNFIIISGGVELENEVGDIEQDEEDKWTAFVSEKWVRDNHQRAIPMLNAAPYESQHLWWAGVVCDEIQGDWPFPLEAFSDLLPSSHIHKAKTWLGIYEQAKDGSVERMNTAEMQIEACSIAGLLKWLHGYESASGNGYNDYDSAEAIEKLCIDKFFLGFSYASVIEDCYDWDRLLINDDGEESVDDVPSAALTLLTDHYLSQVHKSLIGFFGGELELFWTMHSLIWPDFSRSAAEACDALVNSDDYDDIASLSAEWRFVEEGWVDEADNL